MPESRRRTKTTRKPTQAATNMPDVQEPSPDWLPRVAVVFMLIGLLWMVTSYVAAGSIPFMESLGGWNMAVGMAFVMVGFGFLTQWR